MIQSLQAQKQLVDKLNEKLNLLKTEAKPTSTIEKETNYFTHFLVVILITASIIFGMLTVGKDKEQSLEGKRRKKQKVEDDLPPLEKPTYIDDLDDEELDHSRHRHAV